MVTERMPLRKKRIIAAIVIGLGIPWLVLVGFLWTKNERRTSAIEAARLRIRLAALTKEQNADLLAVDDWRSTDAKRIFSQLDSLIAADSIILIELESRK